MAPINSSVLYGIALLGVSYVCFLNSIQCVAVGPDADGATPSRMIMNYIDHSYDCVAASKLSIAASLACSLLFAAMAGAHAGAGAFEMIANKVRQL
jgi:hypothetical protein